MIKQNRWIYTIFIFLLPLRNLSVIIMHTISLANREKPFRLMIKVKVLLELDWLFFLYNKESHKHQRTSRKIWLTLYTNNQKHPIFSSLAFCLFSSYLLRQHKHIYPTLNLILRSVHVACNGLYQPKIAESENKNSFCFSPCILWKVL